MTGIGLNSVNKPDLNFLKVALMVLANVIGDLAAVFIFRSLLAVAVASVVFTLLGAWLGFFLLDRQIRLNWKRIDRVYVLSRGEVVFDGAPEDLQNDDRIIRRYLEVREYEEEQALSSSML